MEFNSEKKYSAEWTEVRVCQFERAQIVLMDLTQGGEQL